MVTKPPNVYKYLSVFYIHSMLATCFGHTCVNPRGGASERVYYKNLLDPVTALQIGRSRVRFPVVSLEFFY
jgi:hypothetical protein